MTLLQTLQGLASIKEVLGLLIALCEAEIASRMANGG